MSDAKTYTGSCHCGAVRFTTKADLAGAGTREAWLRRQYRPGTQY